MPEEKPYVAPFIRRLMPNATEAEIEEASDNLRTYVMFLYRIFLRQEAKRALGDSQQSELDARFASDGDPPTSL